MHVTCMSDILPVCANDLFAVLDDLGVVYRTYDHEPVFTVAEGTEVEKSIPGVHCRNLFLRDKKKKMFLVTAANETPVDLKALPDVLECGRLSFGSAERLWEYLGVRPGSVCPFAVINDRDEHAVQIVLDAEMMAADLVCYHPMENHMTVALSPNDLLKFLVFTGHAPYIINLRTYKFADLKTFDDK